MTSKRRQPRKPWLKVKPPESFWWPVGLGIAMLALVGGILVWAFSS